jgi:hypothetical protein
MASLTQDQMRRLARLGAMARLDQLRQEEAAIRAEFPDLFGRRRRRAAGPDAAESTAMPTGARKSSDRKMSAANRKAVSERMRRYWAERRKAKAGKAGK